MGCWGITAFESDDGLDAVIFIKDNLPEDGKLKLEEIIDAMQQDGWNVPPAVTDGDSHSSPMALAEVVVKLMDHDLSDLDSEFSAITSFTASKKSIRWLRNYLSDTLNYAVKNAGLDKLGGWRTDEMWVGWKKHMHTLVGRMNDLLASPDKQIELIRPQEQENGSVMGQSL